MHRHAGLNLDHRDAVRQGVVQLTGDPQPLLHRPAPGGFVPGPLRLVGPLLDLADVQLPHAERHDHDARRDEPSGRVEPLPANYVAYLVETRSGESLLGILAAETATSVTVRQPFGKDTVVLRSDVKRIESQQLSLMPEGLEEGLKPQDMADLMEFIFVVH